MSVRAPSIYASLLTSDVGRLADEVAELEQSGAIAGLHVDVMDGHFVPNLAFGPQAVEALSKRTNLPIEVHLMVTQPALLLPIFTKAGAQRLIVHREACPRLHEELALIRELDAEPGVALNPDTDVAEVDAYLPEIDHLLLMGVYPGFGGQPFIESVAQKVAAARRAIDRCGSRAKINIDGGVKLQNAHRLAELGADFLVVGSALFAPPSIGACAARFASLFKEEIAV